MSLIAFLLVFASVFLHVAWNFISKKVKPSLAFYSLMSLTASIVWIPFFVVSDFRFVVMPWQFYLLYFFSVICEVVYMTGLANAYKKGDISLVYPVARALPVLMIAILTVVLGLGKTPTSLALFGMVIVTLGCLIMPFKSFRNISIKVYFSRTIIFVLLAAVGTTGYTLLDSSAMEIVRLQAGDNILNALAYLWLMESGLTIGEFILIAKNKTERKLFKKLFLRSIYPIVAGLCSSGAYGLILTAMQYVNNVSYIQAFRQLSLPIGFFAGVLILKESGTKPKIIGITLVIIGLILTAIAS